MALIDEEFTYKLRGCFFDVQKQIGFGLPEEAYQKGLIKAFAACGIPARPHPHLALAYRNRKVLELIPDFVVAERVVVELKALREDFAREHFIQLFSYLKASRIRLGFLVNSGRERIFDERRVFDEKPVAIKEDWDAVKGRIEGTEKDSMAAVRQALLTVANQYGLGYGEGIYRKLFTTVLEDVGHCLNLEPWVEPHYNGQPLGEFPIDCIVVDGQIPCVVMALKDGLSQFDLARAESYVSNLGLRFGVAVNFGKNELEMKAVSTA
ncbi:MAG: GxxExxY protein [Planctomycetes bacterium]|nr:GxxExxY protein [Planctomycetota bacterium]MBL7043817.1 GxxExxY protein [Pirellulaceae bacterium]